MHFCADPFVEDVMSQAWSNEDALHSCSDILVVYDRGHYILHNCSVVYDRGHYDLPYIRLVTENFHLLQVKTLYLHFICVFF